VLSCILEKTLSKLEFKSRRRVAVIRKLGGRRYGFGVNPSLGRVVDNSSPK
jgi:hypothetical protein